MSEKYLRILDKRIRSFAKESESTVGFSKHPVWIVWSNYKQMINENDLFDMLLILSEVSYRIDGYLKFNLIEDDNVIHHVLFEMNQYLFLDVRKLKE